MAGAAAFGLPGGSLNHGLAYSLVLLMVIGFAGGAIGALLSQRLTSRR